MENHDISIKFKIKNNLNFISYVIISFMAYGFFILFLNDLSSFLISLIIIFILTLKDLYSEKIYLKYEYPVNTTIYIILSVSFLLFLWQFLEIFPELLGIFIIILLTMQFGTIYGISKTLEQYKSDKKLSEKTIDQISLINDLLLNCILIGFCLYGAFLSTNFAVALNKPISSLTTMLFLMLSFLFIFLLYNAQRISVNEKFNSILKLSVFNVFQLFFGIFWFSILVIFDFFNNFSVWLIILAETLFFIYVIRILFEILEEKEDTSFKDNVWILFYLILNLEIFLLLFGLFYLFLGINESILFSLSILFIISVLEITSIQKLRKGYSFLINTIIFFIISVSLFLFLYQFVSINPDFLSFILFLIISMQFYTIYVLFIAFNELFPDKSEILKKWKDYSLTSIGIAFYCFLGIFVQRFLALAPLEYQLLLLAGFAHALMYLDQYVLKFLGKTTNYTKLISWFPLMGFSVYFLVVQFAFSLLVIPLILLVLIVEMAYLFKLLDFLTLVNKSKDKIRKVLILFTYLDCITCPLWFASIIIEPYYELYILNLFFISVAIICCLAFVDNFIEVFTKNFRLILFKSSFFTIGVFLSLDLFFVSELFFQSNLPLNLNIFILINVLFLGAILRPFRLKPVFGFVYWFLIFLLLSLIVYFATLSNLAWTILIIGSLLFPFVFMLEELRELFSKLMDVLSKAYERFKEAVAKAINAFVEFLKKYLKIIWLCVMVTMSITVFFLTFIYWDLWWVHSLLVAAVVLGLLSMALPTEETDDPDILFKRKMIKLIILWGSIIGALFGFLPLDWYLLILWIGLWILGAVLIPFIIYKEKRENISIKWRFYTLIFLIIALVLFGILLFMQISTYS